MKVLLVSKNCPHCPEAIRQFKLRHPDGIVLDIESPQGAELARKYGVTYVPKELHI